MRVLSRNIAKDGSGSLKLLPQEADDIWHLYNLIAIHDSITANSTRKVSTMSSTGSTNSTKMRITLTIRVDSCDFDVQTNTIRVKGVNMVENEYVKMGASHTIDLSINEAFTLTKEDWDTEYLNRVDECCNVAKKADVAVLIMQSGLANLCLLTSQLTVTKAKIEFNIPKKRANALSNHDNASVKFFNICLEAILKHVDFSVIKCLIIASPGFLKEEFSSYMWSEASRLGLRPLLDNKSKIVLAHSSNGHKHAIAEVLKDPELSNKLSDTKSVSEIRVLEQFHSLLMTDPDRAYYGIDHVRYAVSERAVQTLLITDELFRAEDIATRRAFLALCDECRAQGADVHVYSTQHVSGEQLAQLSGIAAILRFPIGEQQMEEHQAELNQQRQQLQSNNQTYQPEIDVHSDEEDVREKVENMNVKQSQNLFE